MKVRERILQTASRLFHHQGYNSTGINQIISESEIARGSFYYNFKSKEELCVCFLNNRHDFWMEELDNFVQRKQDNQHQAPIIRAFDFLIHMNEKENFRGCSFLNILSEISDANRKILEVIQSHKSGLRKYVTLLLDNRELGDHTYLLFEGALIESQLFKNQWPVNKAKAIVESLI